ncbi:MAG: hypothetical protein LBK94_02380 [Prevotellaceae bacterium]|nr:hypothetical protein [Prevotellaceae bacterium]
MKNCLQFDISFLLHKTLYIKTSCNSHVNLNLYKDFNIPMAANKKFCSIVLFVPCKVSGLACPIKNLFTGKKHTLSVPTCSMNLKVKRRAKVV